MAATVSVAETIAPSTKAAPQLNPGMTSWATTATAPVVSRTRTPASSVTPVAYVRRWRGEESQPAACSSGGRNTRKITSGATSISDTPGR